MEKQHNWLSKARHTAERHTALLIGMGGTGISWAITELPNSGNAAEARAFGLGFLALATAIDGLYALDRRYRWNLFEDAPKEPDVDPAGDQQS